MKMRAMSCQTIQAQLKLLRYAIPSLAGSQNLCQTTRVVLHLIRCEIYRMTACPRLGMIGPLKGGGGFQGFKFQADQGVQIQIFKRAGFWTQIKWVGF